MKRTTSETLIINLNMLMNKTGTKAAWIAEKSGVSKRMIEYILDGERKSSIEIAEKIANAYGISGWQLIMPSLPYDLAKTGQLDKLINNYFHCNQITRAYVNDVMERESNEDTNISDVDQHKNNGTEK
ncbi:MAG: helix-turn-helix transcriptional regulator [Methylotenera sp.]